MPANFSPPGYRWFDFLRHPPAKVGIYTGLWLSVIFVAWVVIANRVPFLEQVAQQRNGIATLLLALIASMPVIRFLRSPGRHDIVPPGN